MNKGIFDRTIFTQKDRDLLNLFYSLSTASEYFNENAPYMLMRVNTISLSDNTDTFVVTTSAHSDDTIFYTSESDVIDLDVRDGGFF